MLPYYEGTIIADLNECADEENYLYIDARNPEKVIAKDFAPYGDFEMSHTVPENGWTEAASNGYGTLKDLIISFPKNSFSTYNWMFDEWVTTCYNDGLKIALPGADIEDYTIASKIDFCQPSSSVSFNLEYGSSAAKAMGGVYEGYFQDTDANLTYIAANGTELENGLQSYKNLNDGMHTSFVILLDADGNVKASKTTYFFVYNDTPDDWATIGTTDFADDIYGSAYATRLAYSKSHQVEVQQHKTKAGLYRIVDPYNSKWEHYMRLSLYLDRHEHPHYIVIDASDPEKVVMKSLQPRHQRYLCRLWHRGIHPLFQPLAGPTRRRPLRHIQARHHHLPRQEPRILRAHQPPRIRCEPERTHAVRHSRATGIEGVQVDSDDACTYYNLQGIRLANPAEGQLVIKRTATTTEKIIF